MLRQFRIGLLTSFGLGRIPIASGTWGTLLGVLWAVLLGAFFTGWAFALSLWILFFVLLVFGCLQTKLSNETFKTKDPSAFVLDEVVGYLIAAAIYVSFHGSLDPTGHAFCFLLFRFFDITKIQPAKRLEELPGAYGIMLDDVVAGIYAGLALCGCRALGLI